MWLRKARIHRDPIATLFAFIKSRRLWKRHHKAFLSPARQTPILLPGSEFGVQLLLDRITQQHFWLYIWGYLEHDLEAATSEYILIDIWVHQNSTSGCILINIWVHLDQHLYTSKDNIWVYLDQCLNTSWWTSEYILINIWVYLDRDEWVSERVREWVRNAACTCFPCGIVPAVFLRESSLDVK